MVRSPNLYDLSAYGAMIADQRRMNAYRQSMRRRIGPKTTVLDIGTGTGALAFIACELGAGRVFAVEPSDAIQVARQIATDNGLDERIVFIPQRSTDIDLPDRADLLVSDLRGVLPLFRDHLPTIVDARRRLLAPDGAMIPTEDRLFAAVVEAPLRFDELVGPWIQKPGGVDQEAARRLATQTWRKCRFEAEQLLSAPHRWLTLDYRQVDDLDAAGAFAATISRDGTAHGIAVWFETTLDAGVELSNRPGEPELIYGSAFFPFAAPVEVAGGTRVEVDLSADLVGDDYVWRWNTKFHDGTTTRELRQSTFYGALLSPEALRRQAASHAPRLSLDGRIDAEALAMMDGATTLSEIADRLAERLPDCFSDRRAALRHVAALSLRYGR